MIKKIIKFVIKIIKNNFSKPHLYYMETHICDHCNLNCKGCGHYSPLVDEEFTDFNQFKKDINKLASKVTIGQIRLMGGEPLLHKQINEFIEATRKAFPQTDVRIVTNGILLPAMKKDFWETLRQNDIVIDLSKYPPCKDKFQGYLDLIEKNNVKIGNINICDNFFKQGEVFENSNIKDNYDSCLSKYCINLWRSKLYTCPACYAFYFGKYFNIDVKIQEGLDIYKLSGKKILKKMYKPIPQCINCNTKNPKEYPWSYSEKKKEEWC